MEFDVHDLSIPFRVRSAALKFRSFSLIVVLLLAGGVVRGEDTSPTLAGVVRPAARIAFVDMELVLDRSAAVRTIVGEIDQELGRRSGEIDAKKRELARLKAGLEKQGAVLSAAEKKKREEQALGLLDEIDELQFRFQREVRSRQQSTIEPLLEQVILVIGDVGRRDGYDLVVRGEVVLYGRDTVDLTPGIIKELDGRVEQLRKAVEAAPKSKDPKPDLLPLVP